ncbi:MAG: hypothetical protein HY692_03920 [Cyanobacteria bacterium NC_groundwater_1444_Ag_S-0.65um_54_12]|nr:hypothetical protein [Cyanobacteria bacterium NC_groundwater_1444_Ag_S-0.65um_54_12]
MKSAYQGPDRRKHPRHNCHLPLELLPPDHSLPLRGTIVNLGSGGLLAALYRPLTYYGLEPYLAQFWLRGQEIRIAGDWEVRCNARVVALDFLTGQDSAVFNILAYLREVTEAKYRPTGQTTRRVTYPRRAEAITVRRMLEQLALGAGKRFDAPCFDW